MGGAIVGQWLSQTGHGDRVAGIALDSPDLSFRRALAGIAAARGLPAPVLVARAALLWQAAVGAVDVAGAEVEEPLARWSGPLFLAHGTGDRVVPSRISTDLVARHAGPTELLVTDGDHLQSWAADPGGYAAAFARFLTLATGD